MSLWWRKIGGMMVMVVMWVRWRRGPWIKVWLRWPAAIKLYWWSPLRVEMRVRSTEHIRHR